MVTETRNTHIVTGASMDPNLTQNDIHFFNKEITRLNSLINQYQQENLLIKTELKNNPTATQEFNALKDQIKDLMRNNEETLMAKEIEILKLQETIKDKDSQIEVLTANLNKPQAPVDTTDYTAIIASLEKANFDLQDGIKEERKLLVASIENLKAEKIQLTNAIELKDKQILALKTKFEDFLLQTSEATTRGKKSKKDLAYQEIIDIKEKEILELKQLTESTIPKLKELVTKINTLDDELKYKNAENKLLREKYLQVADFCNKLSESIPEVDTANYKKIASFCRSVAESKLTVTRKV